MAGTNNLYEVALSGGLNGQFVQNVLHVELEPTTGSADPFLYAVSLAQSVAEEWVPLYLTCLPDTYVISSVRARGLTPLNSATATAIIPSGDNVGARAGAFSTYVEGPLLIFPVTFTGPSLGKIYMPGVSEEDIDYGVLETGLMAVLISFITALMTVQHSSGSNPIDYHYVVAKSDHSDWKTPAGGTVSPTIGTQRRRAKPLF